jgi:hypothetical protein
MGNIDSAALGLEPKSQTVSEPDFVVDHENAHLTKYGIARLKVS